MLYDAKQNSGWLVASLKNMRTRDKIRESQPTQSVEPSGLPIMQAEQEFEWLKSIKIDRNNIHKVEEKLKLTSAYRKQLMLDPLIDVLEYFPYLFTHPELLLFDFKSEHEAASAKLIEKWPGYRSKVEDLLQFYGLKDEFATSWPKDIEEFLILLKLLPASGSKSSSGIKTFNESIDDLIKFEPVRTGTKIYSRTSA